METCSFPKSLEVSGYFLCVPSLPLFANLTSVPLEFQPPFPSHFPGLGDTGFQMRHLKIPCVFKGGPDLPDYNSLKQLVKENPL